MQIARADAGRNVRLCRNVARTRAEFDIDVRRDVIHIVLGNGFEIIRAVAPFVITEFELNGTRRVIFFVRAALTFSAAAGSHKTDSENYGQDCRKKLFHDFSPYFFICKPKTAFYRKCASPKRLFIGNM